LGRAAPAPQEYKSITVRKNKQGLGGLRMKFDKKKVDALTGKTEVHYTLAHEGQEFRIIAASTGVRFQGNSPEFFEQADVQALAQIIGQAFTDFTRLKPRLTLSGE
jgi:hypothetical protein